MQLGLGWLLLAGMLCWHSLGWAAPSVAFFYGDKPPMHDLRAFDWVVVEPGHLPDPKPFDHAESRLFAYVSLGEVLPSSPVFARFPKDWLKGENAGWGSRVIDQTAPGWAEFAVEQLFAPLWQAGYQGFFLDTLDSFHLIATDDASRAAQARGLAQVIRLLKQRYPQASLLLNRGFEVLPSVHELVNGVVFESWFEGYDAAKGHYRAVPQQDRDWLAGQLAKVRHYGLPIVAIDYVPASERGRAREVARRLQAEGFTPWVSVPELDMLGVGSVEVEPRRVLMVTDPVLDEYEMHESPGVLFPTSVLNMLGQAVDYVPVNQLLPAQPLAGRYAGVVVNVEANLSQSQSAALSVWLRRQLDMGVPVVLLRGLEYVRHGDLAGRLGLTLGAPGALPVRLTLLQRHSAIGYEAEPVLDRGSFFALNAEGAEVWLRLGSESGQSMDAVAITAWGGYALNPHVTISSAAEPQANAWVTDPVSFFRQALRLRDMPLPDVTSETGRRMLMVHHDGDGFPSRAELPGSPYAGQVLLDQVVRKYRLPMSLSVIEGEVSPKGLYPADAAELERIYRQIFAHEHVELASHTYSHPFSWSVVAGDRQADNRYQKYNLALPGYRPSMEREVQGSIDYINQRLAPAGKQVRILNWSGDCNPGLKALSLVRQAGVVSVNGGDTTITRRHPSLTNVSPVGIAKGDFFQVYAPNQNENVYTNDWRGPFFGHERAIETFELTETPRRIKPVNIYFHTYALSKKVSTQALHKLFDWAIAQPLHPVFMSEYVHKAEDFHRVVVARDRQGWRIRGLDQLRQLRIPARLGLPDLKSSYQVAGFVRLGDEVLVHASDILAHLVLSVDDGVPHVQSANARLVSFKRTPQGFQAQFAGHVPLQMDVAHAQQCQVRINGEKVVAAKTAGGALRFRSRHVAGTMEALCRP